MHRSIDSDVIVVQNNGGIELRFSLRDGSTDVRLTPDGALSFPCKGDGKPVLASVGDFAGFAYLVALSCGDILELTAEDGG